MGNTTVERTQAYFATVRLILLLSTQAIKSSNVRVTKNAGSGLRSARRRWNLRGHQATPQKATHPSQPQGQRERDRAQRKLPPP